MSNHDGLVIEAERLAGELRKRGDDWADKDAAYKALEEVQKSVLANSFVATDGSVAEREAKARISPAFMEHLGAIAKARQEANRARVSYDVYRTYVELMRSNASTQRALVNLT
jgi:hypothetical protein